jgi:hypothetical protein
MEHTSDQLQISNLAQKAREWSGPALRAFFRIAEFWKLNTNQQMRLLGLTNRSTLSNWKKRRNGLLPKDTLERISYLLGIYKALQILLPNPEAADAWVNKPNDGYLFGGRTALDYMLNGHVSDLYDVRRYLDSERGG